MYLSIHLCIYLCIHLCIHPSIYLSMHPSIRLYGGQANALWSDIGARRYEKRFWP